MSTSDSFICICSSILKMAGCITTTHIHLAQETKGNTIWNRLLDTIIPWFAAVLLSASCMLIGEITARPWRLEKFGNDHVSGLNFPLRIGFGKLYKRKIITKQKKKNASRDIWLLTLYFGNDRQLSLYDVIQKTEYLISRIFCSCHVPFISGSR